MPKHIHFESLQSRHNETCEVRIFNAKIKTPCVGCLYKNSTIGSVDLLVFSIFVVEITIERTRIH